MSKLNRTVQITVNPEDAVRAMRYAFTNSDQALPELLQNARRAGATSIELSYDEASHTLTIIDDGCGISDFQKLLAHARSGWSDEVQAAEDPYGLGFYAGLFGCEHIDVQSGTSRLSANTQDLLRLTPVGLEDIGPFARKGTMIKMVGCRFRRPPTAESVATLVRGFPVPVRFNGHEVPRPDAINAHTDWHNTPVGQIRVTPGAANRYAVYLQGLPICGVSEGRWLQSTAVCHLASPRFRGRTPDRDTLVDAAQAQKDLHHAHEEVQRKLLTLAKADAQGAGDEALAAFVAKHADDCITYGCASLLSDVPWVPANWLWHYRDLPRYRNYDDDQEMVASGAPRAPLGAKVVAQCDMPGVMRVAEHDPDELTMVAETYAWALGAVSLEPRIARALKTSGHWVLAMCDNLATFDQEEEKGDEITISTTNPRPLAHIGAVLCEAIRLSGARGDVTLAADAGVYDASTQTLIVQSRPCPDLLAQAMDYRNEDNDYEEAITQDYRRLCQAIAVASGDAPERIFERALCDVRHELPTALRGHSFIVTIGADGQLTATPHTSP